MENEPKQESKAVNKRGIVAWCLYDWANSSFSAVVVTFVIATYFTGSVAKSKIIGTSQWGHAMALSGLIIALVSPFLGAIADCEGRRKPWLFVATWIAIISTALLWYVYPNPSSVPWALFWVVIAIIGIEVGFVFYNAMLHDLAPSGYLGRISGWAWGLGYLGGLVCLVVTLVVFIDGHGFWLNLNIDQAEQVRICAPFVAVWLALFSLPLFLMTPDRPRTGLGFWRAGSKGMQTLLNTMKQLPQHKELLKFLIARMIYIDGLNTLFAFGGIYAAGTFGLDTSEVIKFGIGMNVTAGIGAASFAWLDDYIGAKKTILISLFCMLIAGTMVLFTYHKLMFWVLALTLGLFVGPVQASSRSLMARIAPAEIMTEMFGLYAMSGKITAFLGPWVFAFATVEFNSQRAGMGTAMLFLLVGAVLLLTVRVPRHRMEA